MSTETEFNLKFVHKSSKALFLGRPISTHAFELKNKATGELSTLSVDEIEQDYLADFGNELRKAKLINAEKDQVPMAIDLPVYQEDLEKVKAKSEKKSVNCLQEMLIELMNGDVDEYGNPIPGGRKPSSLADIQKATQIPWPTLWFWYKGDVTAQVADENLLNLARYFKVSLEYLCFGLGSDKPMFEEFTEKSGNN